MHLPVYCGSTCTPSSLKLRALDTVRRPSDIVSACGNDTKALGDPEKNMYFMFPSFSSSLFLQNQFAIDSRDSVAD